MEDKTMLDNNQTPAQQPEQTTPPTLHLDGTYQELYEFFPPESFETIGLIGELTDAGKTKDAAAILDKLSRDYADNRYIQCHAAFAYHWLKKGQKSFDLMEKTFFAHPDDLLVRSLFARLCLFTHRHQLVPAIFNWQFDLQKMYPGKDTFYAVEVIEYFYTLGLFFCAIDNIKAAQSVQTKLAQFLPAEHKTLINLEREIQESEHRKSHSGGCCS